jgi:NAD(P)-dependent dehydrogenase (short-subunit alcohol dehydrogenase family)
VDELGGRVAVVTGAASGIGHALAQRFASEGMHVVMADVEQRALESAAEAVRATGADVEAVRTDVADAGAVDALRDRAVERFGGVHLLCNNAGVVTLKPLWEQTLEDWRWVVGVDLWGVIHGVQSFLPLLLDRGLPSHIVNTASIAGLVPSPTIGPYNVCKAGVVALSETLDMELREAGAPVGVSVLCPGVVPTQIADSGRNRPGGGATPLDLPTQADLPPTARTPEQIADAVVRAIREDQFWIITHDGSAEVIHQRADGMTCGARPVPPPVF